MLGSLSGLAAGWIGPIYESSDWAGFYRDQGADEQREHKQIIDFAQIIDVNA